MMDLKIEKLPFGERNNKFVPDDALLEHLGEEGIRKLVNDHYELLIQSDIADMFPKSKEGLEQAKKNSADYFIERLGGPKYYAENRGKPMLSRRHAPFKISSNARITWLNCYKQLLEKLNAPDYVIIAFWDWLHELSNWMVNALDNDDYVSFKPQF